MDATYKTNQFERSIAVFEFESGKQLALMPTYDNGLYREYLDYNGMFLWGATQGNSIDLMNSLKYYLENNLMKVVKSPGSLYHCWHVCFCEDCALYGGKVFDHSQATFNEHFKSVPVNRIFTFPSAK